MKQLWAPWRKEYIEGKREEGCIFCKVKEKEQQRYVLFSGSISTVMLNRYPYNSGHLMVAPLRHTGKLEALTPEESLDILRLLRHSTTVLTKVLSPEGFNIGMNIGKAAGAGIEDHLHMHIVPRWNGDTNFMPVMNDVKIISAHLQETGALLKPYFERIV